MSRTLHEHDYIGLSESPSMENSDNKKTGLTLKATELRLGLPGSESPERDTPDKNATLLKGYVSGAKRGFCDALNVGSGKWVFAAGGVGSNGAEADVCSKGNGGAVLFSPRGGGIGVSAVKDFAPQSPKLVNDKKPQVAAPAPATAKEQVVGWPPIRSFRKNSMASQSAKSDDDAESKKGSRCLYVKVSMDGAPYLRKVDLKNYGSYMELSSGLEKMFSCFTIGQCGSHGVPGRDGLSESHLIDLLHGSEYVLTYEDKDRDWMLVGDVPWRMFTETCKRLRIMKSSDAIGLAPRAMDKCKGCD